MVLAEASQREGLNSDAEVYTTQALDLIPDDAELRVDALVLMARFQHARGEFAAVAASIAAADRLLAKFGDRPTSARAWIIWLKARTVEDTQAAYAAATREAIQVAINAEGPLSPTAIDMQVGLGRGLIQLSNFSEGRDVIASATSALRTAGGPSALRAAVVDANAWRWLFNRRAVSYSEAIATLESSKAVLSSSSAPVPPIVLQKIEFELAVARVEGGDLALGGPALKTVAPALLASAHSRLVRFDIVSALGSTAMQSGEHDLAGELLTEVKRLRKEWDWTASRSPRMTGPVRRSMQP